MDKMDLISILAVSLPEAILNVYFVFLLMGFKTYLILNDRSNVIRLAVTIPLMVTAAVISRALLTNLVFVVLVNIVIYTLILIAVYRFKWYIALFIVLGFYGLLIAIEAAYLSPYIVFIAKSTERLYSDDLIRIGFSLPERIIQTYLIVSMWNLNSAFIDIGSNKRPRYMFIFVVVILFLGEVSFLALLLYSFEKVSQILQIISTIGSISFAAVNFLLFKFVSVFTDKVMNNSREEKKAYKNQVKADFRIINDLLEKGEIEKAKKICKGNLLE